MTARFPRLEICTRFIQLKGMHVRCNKMGQRVLKWRDSDMKMETKNSTWFAGSATAVAVLINICVPKTERERERERIECISKSYVPLINIYARRMHFNSSIMNGAAYLTSTGTWKINKKSISWKTRLWQCSTPPPPKFIKILPKILCWTCD